MKTAEPCHSPVQPAAYSYIGELAANRQLEIVRLRVALAELRDAGEMHMTFHPKDGAAWHKANAEFYKALNTATESLAL